MCALDISDVVRWPACNDETSPPPRSSKVTMADLVDAASRLIGRRSDHRLRWSAIAREAGIDPLDGPPEWLEDLPELLDACYARTEQALADSLLRAETAPGTALDKLAAFLVAALEARRRCGTLLSFRRGLDLPEALQRRLHERDMMVRTRLKRLLRQGRGDGSLAQRNLDSACELILASLMAPDVAVSEPEQMIWDSELIELLLAALAEPHPPEPASGPSADPSAAAERDREQPPV
jgi:AcrR family transcriptional regulator